ncbi:glucans biosynthesis glucosyltransferase MdoH [Roseomonas sp. CECT 9278]|uniref:glucans biosynthesis glucosyltransferase MdoH n=1 Tax=Roseomonas sp. CECT 9278 TaxID=2845823 RepID=UPI001E652066|nr:glucans biosynthesis glucosyltransferase MdoH [Roseomonas sp. CECT 9278]
MTAAAAADEILPAEAPLAMPVQDLRQHAEPAPGRFGWRMALRRALVLGGAGIITGFASAEMSLVLGLARWTVTGAALTLLYAVLLFWIALAFTTALAGAAAMLRAHRVVHVAPTPASRTALLMPVCHEHVPALRATLVAMRAGLLQAGVEDDFDIFLLSDSRVPETVAQERALVRDLRATPGPPVWYRRRTDNEGRKAGNVAEWMRRFGAAYGQFLVLDADSVMEADTLVTLVAMMERDPRAGLLQTLPVLEGGQTPFAQLQQFASAVHGPVLAHGLAWWHGRESNYWGHNALIRTVAFAQAAGLPVLPGRRPFGGEILSHDFVEAALLRRAGWSVQMVPGLGGSHERGPPTLAEMAQRDRRWFQGNLQHAAVIGARGLHPMGRLHMASGIAAYASAPLWLGFLVLGLVATAQARLLRPEYFPDTHALFPQWPVFDGERAVWVLAGTMLLLLAPKVIGLLLSMLRPDRALGLLGALRLVGGAVLEILVSMLLSPITMLTQSLQWIGVLRGVDGGWAAQRRDGGGARLRDAIRATRAQVVLGLTLTAAALSIDPMLCLWMWPVLAGLVLAPLVVAATSSLRLGDWLRASRLFETTTDVAPGPVLRQARHEALQAPAAPCVTCPPMRARSPAMT